jgi:atypical dual specificity phosphatase
MSTIGATFIQLQGRARRLSFVTWARSFLVMVGVLTDTDSWLVPGRLLACAYPRSERALALLSHHEITVLINLHERSHDPVRLARYGLREHHFPIVDFGVPSPSQLAETLATITAAIADGERVAVHCGGGLGRTGTVMACYLVQQGAEPQAAIDRIRQLRPGSVETRAQEAAVHAFAAAQH